MKDFEYENNENIVLEYQTWRIARKNSWNISFWNLKNRENLGKLSASLNLKAFPGKKEGN